MSLMGTRVSDRKEMSCHLKLGLNKEEGEMKEKELQDKLSGAAVNRKCFIKGILAAGAAPAIVPARVVLGKDAPSNKIAIAAASNRAGPQGRSSAHTARTMACAPLKTSAKCAPRRMSTQS